MYLREYADEIREILDLLLQPEIEIPKLLPDESNMEEVEELTRQKALYEEALNNTLESFMADFEDKAENYGWILKEMERSIESLKKTKLEIEKKQKAVTNRYERTKNTMNDAMAKIGKKKLKTETWNYSTRTSKSVVVDAESVFEISDEFLRYPDPEPDKTAIKAYLQENPDCAWAHMEEKTSLVVK